MTKGLTLITITSCFSVPKIVNYNIEMWVMKLSQINFNLFQFYAGVNTCFLRYVGLH